MYTKANRKLLVVYILITKSAKQRERIIKLLTSKHGSVGIRIFIL